VEIVRKYLISTSLKTQSVSFTKTNQLMLCREITAVYYDNDTVHITVLRDQDAKIQL
jgi:hypothetical protein